MVTSDVTSSCRSSLSLSCIFFSVVWYALLLKTDGSLARKGNFSERHFRNRPRPFTLVGRTQKDRLLPICRLPPRVGKLLTCTSRVVIPEQKFKTNPIFRIQTFWWRENQCKATYRRQVRHAQNHLRYSLHYFLSLGGQDQEMEHALADDNNKSSAFRPLWSINDRLIWNFIGY